MTQQDENLVLVDRKAQVVDNILVTILFEESGDLKSGNLSVMALSWHLDLATLQKVNLCRLKCWFIQLIEEDAGRKRLHQFVILCLMLNVARFNTLAMPIGAVTVVFLRGRAPEALREKIVEAGGLLCVNLYVQRP